jgi:S1-C subfamily serine protease
MIAVIAAPASAGVGPEVAQKIHDETAPSLVAVKYTWHTELQQLELVGAGIVVGADGLVMAPIVLFNTQIPDEQMRDFKLLVHVDGKDPKEIDAVFQGRDERNNVVFLKAKDPAVMAWKPLAFEDAPVKIGEPVMSVGMLPKNASYKPYFMEGTVSATLRGETPQVLVHGGLAAVGSPVFNAAGKAIGMVQYQQNQPMRLDDQQAMALVAIDNPPKMFVPARDFLQGISDPPTPEKPVVLPWMGVMQLTGLTKEVAEVFNLEDQPAIQVGGVIPNTAAEKAGLKKGHIIVKLNGEPLERADEPAELPQILQRKLVRMKPGDTVTLSVIPKRGEAPKDIQITLDAMPPRPNVAKRYYAEDLGFAARDVVFFDTYSRRLPAETKGVVIALIRPESAAQTGDLQMNDMVTELNRQPVTDVESFKKLYEETRQAKPKDALVMVVLREGNTQTIRIEPPQ